MSGGVAYAAMSTCDKCGRQFPTAPAGVAHKCICSGGMMVPDATPVQVTLVSPTPPPSRDADVERVAREVANGLDWDKVYAAARKRALNDVTGTSYDEHLAREIADLIARAALQALGERG